MLFDSPFYDLNGFTHSFPDNADFNIHFHLMDRTFDDVIRVVCHSGWYYKSVVVPFICIPLAASTEALVKYQLHPLIC